jgi:hypothetical protein
MTTPVRYYLVALSSFLVGVLGTLALTRPQGSGSGKETPASAVTLVDPQASAASAAAGELAIDDPRISFRQLHAIASRHAAADPEAAVKRAKEIPGHDNREAYLGEVLRAWGEKDGTAAAAFAQSYFQGEQLTDALYYIADGWAEADPAAAADWFNQNTSGTVLDDAIWESLESWGRKDPKAAFVWSDQLDPYVKSTAMQGLAEGWGAVDPAGAAAAGLEMRDTDYGNEFLVSVTTQWAGSDPAAAAAWAGGLVDEQLRGEVVNELGEVWAQTDPPAAAAWVAALTDPGTKRAAETGLAVGWSEHDPGGAIEWALGSVEDPAQLDEMVGDITFNWSNLDPRGATRWLDAQTPGVKTDRVLKAFSGMVLEEDPEAAVVWATKISDPATRDAHVRGLLNGLVGAYGNSARKAIQNFQLPDELKRAYAPSE